MKKIIISIVIALCTAVFSYSQSNQEHFKFNGIPITGNKENFIKELKKQGFKDSNDKISDLEGEFTEKCSIIVFTTPFSNKVFGVRAIIKIEHYHRWNSVMSIINELEERISREYNVSPSSTKEFTSPYYEGDGYEIDAIKVGKCTYISSFEVENGIIQITIWCFNNYGPAIVIDFSDKDGYQKFTDEENMTL